jgi:hypothetical protein
MFSTESTKRYVENAHQQNYIGTRELDAIVHKTIGKEDILNDNTRPGKIEREKRHIIAGDDQRYLRSILCITFSMYNSILCITRSMICITFIVFYV